MNIETPKKIYSRKERKPLTLCMYHYDEDSRQYYIYERKMGAWEPLTMMIPDSVDVRGFRIIPRPALKTIKQVASHMVFFREELVSPKKVERYLALENL